jgi:hypothetical protein
MKSDISAMRAVSNTAETAIAAATTKKDLDAVTPVWPTI